MADGYFPTLVSKDENPNATGNRIFVTTDGTVDVGTLGTITNVVHVDDNAGSLTVDGSVAVSSVSGSVIVVDGGGSLTVDGSVSITGSVTVVDGGGSITVDASSLDIRPLALATDAVKVSANSTANSVSNPIFVALGAGPITGEVHDYNTAAVATNDNHDYTVVTAMLVKGIEFSSSGGAKVELKVGPVASLVSKWVGFVPKAGGTVSVKFDPPIEVPVTSTGTVRLVRTNRENQTQSLYSTIIGIDA